MGLKTAPSFPHVFVRVASSEHLWLFPWFVLVVRVLLHVEGTQFVCFGDEGFSLGGGELFPASAEFL